MRPRSAFSKTSPNCREGRQFTDKELREALAQMPKTALQPPGLLHRSAIQSAEEQVAPKRNQRKYIQAIQGRCRFGIGVAAL